MPAWCARKYPETLRIDKDGKRIRWGIRKDNCMTSGTYRLLSERITRAMAEHYAKTPSVIGWQTDNEFLAHQCFCPRCQNEFHDWLRAKYKSLDTLNRAWGTHFWSQAYGRWDEIVLPDNEGGSNPSTLLDFKRFSSDLDIRFQHEQVQVLREVCPNHFVTHNLMGLFPHLDYFKFSEDLDHVSWDNYPIRETFDEIHFHAAAAADLMRGVKRKNFWIMEQTVGPHGWGTFGRNVRPGEIYKIALQQIAHGADHIMWFRWRSCTAGREQYWHGVLGHDGKPLRRYREVKEAAARFHKLAPALEGTTLKPKVAFIHDYESRWALTFQPSYSSKDDRFISAMNRYYDALLRAGVNADMIHPGQDLSGYKVVFAPHLYIMPDDLAKRLDAFVKAGGVLVTDCRTGVKDETSLCHDRTLPGLLSKCLGIAVEEYESLNSIEYPAIGSGPLEGNWTAILFADWIKAKGADVLATLQPWHVKNFPLATRNRYGKGTGYYVAAPVKEKAFYDALIADVLKSAGLKPILNVPDGVEVTLREGKGRRILFLINHLEEPREVATPSRAKDLLTGKAAPAKLTLGAYGCAVLQL